MLPIPGRDFTSHINMRERNDLFNIPRDRALKQHLIITPAVMLEEHSFRYRSSLRFIYDAVSISVEINASLQVNYSKSHSVTGFYV